MWLAAATAQLPLSYMTYLWSGSDHSCGALMLTWIRMQLHLLLLLLPRPRPLLMLQRLLQLRPHLLRALRLRPQLLLLRVRLLVRRRVQLLLGWSWG